jgi:carbon storage regulator CsrA
MLVFARKPGECFMIGDNVTVTIDHVQGDRVWIRFDAPRAIPIFRQELLGASPCLNSASEPEDEAFRRDLLFHSPYSD